ncbi:MAG: hypothetical protein ABH869_06055, partial [Candidatus Omnitrophota bacterium]
MRIFFKTNFFQRVISGILAVAVFFSAINNGVNMNSAWAFEVLPVGNSDVFSMSHRQPQIDLLARNSFNLPLNLGTIQDQDIRNTDNLIVHIQDAHANYACQRTISDIIAYLISTYGISKVYLEGGAGEYDLAPFYKIIPAELRARVSDLFLRQAEINGAEYFAINYPGKAELAGIENKELYLANLEVYKNFLEAKPDADICLKQMEGVLTAFKNKVFSVQLLEFDSKYSEGKSGKLKFKEYIKYLLCTACEYPDIKENSRDFTNINVLAEIIEREEDIDFKSANIQRDVLIELLIGKFPKSKLEQFLEKLISFRKGQSSEADFYTYLNEKAVEVDVDISKSLQEFSKYIDYVKIYAEINHSALYEEITLLEESLRKRISTTDIQRKLIRLSKNLEYIKNLLNFSLSRKDYEYYLKNNNEFNVENYLDFFNKYADEFGEQLKLNANLARIDDYRAKVIDFYSYSFKRDEAFVGNIKKRLPRSSHGSELAMTEKLTTNDERRTTVLITGGFHSENLYKLFKENNISYVSILPKYEGTQGRNEYFDILSGKSTSFFRELDAALSNLQIASKLNHGLGEKVWGERNIKLYEAMIYVQSLLENGSQVEIYDAETGEIVFCYGDPEEKIRISKNRFFYEIHEKFIDEIMAPDEEGFRDLTGQETITAQEMIKVVLNSLPENDPAGDFLEKKAQEISSFIRISFNLVKTERSGHAGKRGIRIRPDLSQDKIKEVILHEIFSGIVNNHLAVEQIERLIRQNADSIEIHKILQDPVNRYQEFKTLWEMDNTSEIPRDYAENKNNEEKQAGEVDPEVKSLFEKESYLTDNERKRIVTYVINMHKGYDRAVEKIRRRAADQARYAVSIREIKRFAYDFKRIFLKLTGEEKSRIEAFQEAKKFAEKNVYYDALSPEDLPGKIKGLPEDPDVKILRNALKESQKDDDKQEKKRAELEVDIYKRTYIKLKRVLQSGIPALFIKATDSLQAFETALSYYLKVNKKNSRVFSMQCTPYSNTAQLIGGYVPRERIEKEKAYQLVSTFINDDAQIKEILTKLLDRVPLKKEIDNFKDIYKEGAYDGLVIAAAMITAFPHNWRKKLEYKKGLLARLIDECNANKDKEFILNLENIEALPKGVSAQLNNFLSAGE